MKGGRYLKVDVLVIGAGHAGLTMAYYLKQNNRSFVVVDASKRVGDVWRNRYDSLLLFSPRRYSSLPGMSLTGSQEGFPTKDEFAHYLESYAKKFSLPIHLNTKVEKLEQTGGFYQVETSQGQYIAKDIVIATGPFQKPFIPSLEGSGSTSVLQFHSMEYCSPAQLRKGTTLVVGGGNSGVQIATELSKNQKVYLSSGHEMVFIPRQILSRSIFWWLDLTRLSKVSVDSKVANLLKKTEPVIGLELKPLIKSGKVIIKERAISLHNEEVSFNDGSMIKVDNIIWATGFRFDYNWIDIPGVLTSQNKPVHRRGISPVRGIYFLGLPWLSRVGSSQINGINYDAKNISDYLNKDMNKA